MKWSIFVVAAGLTIPGWGQTGAVKDVGSGAATIGKSTAGAVGNLATGHPVGAASSLGTGVGKGGARMALGAGKGAAKLGKAAGSGIRKLVHL